MSKFIAIILTFAVLLTGCASQTDNQRDTSKEETDNLSSETTADSLGEKGTGTDETKPEVEKQIDTDTVVINSSSLNGFGSKDGFYYIPAEANSDREDYSYYNIKYIDYQTGKEIFLCNKPNCKHDSDKCTSFVDFESGNMCSVFPYGEKLYFITFGIGDSVSIGENNSLSSGASASTPAIYAMNLDGSNKTKIYSLESGYTLEEPFIMMGENLYCASSKSEMVQTADKNYTVKRLDNKLFRLNLSDGKAEMLSALGEKTIIGAYQDNIVLQETLFQKKLADAEIANHDYYMAQLKLADTEISLMDVNTGEVTKLMKKPTKECDYAIQYKNKVYYTFYGSTKIWSLDLDTKKTALLAENLAQIPNINSERDNKLICTELKGNEDDVIRQFAVDCDTGKVSDSPLRTKSTNNAVDIISETEDEFLVINDYVEENNYYAFAGVWQKEIVAFKASLISKSDFYAGKANYREVTKGN